MPKNSIGVRVKDQVLLIARQICIFRVALSLLATTMGLAFRSHYGCGPLTTKAMVDFCYPMLFITVGDTILALTLLEFLFDSSDESDLLHLLASEHFFGATDADMRKGLKAYAHEMQGTPANTAFIRRTMAEGARAQEEETRGQLETANGALATLLTASPPDPARIAVQRQAAALAEVAHTEAHGRSDELNALTASGGSGFGTVSHVLLYD